MSRYRWLALAAALALFVAGAVLSFGPPRLTLVNAGLRVDHAWRFGAAALGSALAAAALAWMAPRRWARVMSLVAATLALVRAANLLTAHLDAGSEGLVAASWTGETRVAWKDVQRVDAGPDVLVVWGREDEQIRIPTSGFRPDQRASLDRAIARRVQGSGEATTIRRAGVEAPGVSRSSLD